MFDLGGEEAEDLEEIKYTYTETKEFDEKELLSMEKEMLGIYITGHPLEKMWEQMKVQTNINTLKMLEIKDQMLETGKSKEYKDGQIVKYAGIINSVKKKYTKNNKIMAFVTVEDLYGQAEIIVFDSVYQNSSSILVTDSIVLVEGRISIREDDDTKIVANKIEVFGEKKQKVLEIDVTNLKEEQKAKLRGTIKFFSGDNNNIPVKIKNGDSISSAGGIFITPRILEEFKKITGNENSNIIEV